MFIAFSALLALGCLLPAAAKLSGQARMRQTAQRFGIPWPRYRLISVPELAAAAGVVIGVWVRPLGIAAAAGMGLLLIGALITHARAKDGPKEMVSALITLIIAIGYLIVAMAG